MERLGDCLKRLGMFWSVSGSFGAYRRVLNCLGEIQRFGESVGKFGRFLERLGEFEHLGGGGF